MNQAEQTGQETISLHQLFAEELSAVNQMLDAVAFVVGELSPLDPEYTELHNERIMLEQTRLYLIARIEDRIPHPLLGE